MICLSKGITGGYLPLGATLCTQSIYEAFFSEDRTKTFLHGHTYAANPLICAAAAANLDLLCDPHCARQRARIARMHRTFAGQIASHPMLKRCECLGTLLALEYRTTMEGTYFSPISDILKQFFLSRNIVVRPLGNVLYLLPPYCLSNGDLEEIYAAILHTLEHPLWKTP
jgi:adenosylmethionine-8-amino-7-oxononanoate aminotransferase